MLGVPPTGAMVRNDSIVIYRFENGLIRERWCRERRTTRDLLDAASRRDNE
jgi:predicted ester cyclase